MKKLQMLRSLSPQLYKYITETLTEKYHIHPYDIQLHGKENETGMDVVVTYGEKFDHQAEHFFTFDVIDEKGEELIHFIDETGEACKKVLIEDYFRTMTP